MARSSCAPRCPSSIRRCACWATVVVTVPIDGAVVDRLRAALGAGREVVVYRGRQPNASTFMGATGARLGGPPVPAEIVETKFEGGSARVVPLEVDGHAYSVAFGQLQDVNAEPVGLLGVAVDREPSRPPAGAPRRRSRSACSWRCSSRSACRDFSRGA